MKATRFPLLVVACGLLSAASCSDPPPRPDAANEPTQSSGLLGPLLGPSGLLSCTQTADSVTQVVGTAGGTIEVGPHQLEIPANALDSNVAITAVAPSGNVNVVFFEPHGLEFSESATLTLSYGNCNLLGLLLPKRIAYTSATLGILSYLTSIDDLLAQEVRTNLDHFSGYAVAW